jgi:hypothetical protein
MVHSDLSHINLYSIWIYILFPSLSSLFIFPLSSFFSVFYSLCLLPRSWGSSVSTVSDYGLDDRGSIPDRGRGFFSSPCVQTGSGAHPASYPMGTWGPFPGDKAQPGRDADHSPHLVPRLRMSRRYTSSHPKRLHGVYRDPFILLSNWLSVYQVST